MEKEALRIEVCLLVLFLAPVRQGRRVASDCGEPILLEVEERTRGASVCMMLSYCERAPL